MGEDWWKQAKGTLIKNQEDFNTYMTGDGKDSFVIVDFFMPKCSWCQKFMPEWNQVVDSMT